MRGARELGARSCLLEQGTHLPATLTHKNVCRHFIWLLSLVTLLVICGATAAGCDPDDQDLASQVSGIKAEKLDFTFHFITAGRLSWYHGMVGLNLLSFLPLPPRCQAPSGL